MKGRPLPLRIKLDNERKRTNVQLNILEQDYLLSWILYGISMVPALKNSLVFKGGTCLKKCYFGDYRFSEDLDFTFVGAPADLEFIEIALIRACNIASTAMKSYMPSPKLSIARYTEKQPHPDGQLAFTVRAQLPWHRAPLVKAMVEITVKEIVVTPPEERKLIHGYGEDMDSTILTYSLEEIIAEKMRAILQFAKKLHEEGIARSRVRDYYDLWSIFQTFDSQINYAAIKDILQKKCALKNITFSGLADFFQQVAVDEVRASWHIWIKPLVVEAPEVEMVLSGVRKRLYRVFD